MDGGNEAIVRSIARYYEPERERLWLRNAANEWERWWCDRVPYGRG